MISVPHLVDEKIWLDKPKYDAAERRYYDRLAKSSESAKVSNSSNTTDSHASAVLDKEPEVENEQEFEISPTAVCKKSDQKSSVKISPVSNTKDSDKTFMKKTEPESVSIKQDSIKPKGEENVCPRPFTELPEHVRPLISDICVLPSGISGYPLKTVIIKESQNENLQMKQELGSKPEKAKKLDLQNITSKTEINKKIESCEITCAKVRGQNKTKSADEKEMKQEIALDKGISGIDPVSEVVKIDDIAVTSNTVSVEITNRLNSLEKENYDLKNQVSELLELFKKMDLRITSLEKSSSGGSKSADNKAPAPAPAPKKDDAEDDDGVDLFGSDSEEEDAEAAKIKEQRLAEYAAKKAKKPVLIAKSNIILDVKPWDDETNMKELEAEVRKITTDGLVWGASKLVPLAYGIHKLQISCVVEDDKVSVDWLQETIQEIEDYVQSVDIAAFNKV